MNNKRLVAVYDFAVMPYALGDVLTWSVKKSVTALNHGLESVVVYICADEKNPSNFHQNQFVTPTNFEASLLELMPAFWSNPMMSEVRVFRSREALMESLSSLSDLDTASRAGLTGYDYVWENRGQLAVVNSYLERQICSHEDINDYAARNAGGIPWLQMPESFTSAVRDLRASWSPEGYFVAMNIRTRAYDPESDDAEQARDANLEVWKGFIERAAVERSDVTFVLTGRMQEKPPALLSLNNLIFPRALGYGLGHELAWVNQADCFMGSSSGFAAMANFSRRPYLITGMNPRACKNYCIRMDVPRLPFARDGQELMYGEESGERLMDFINRNLPVRAAESGSALAQASELGSLVPDLRRGGEWTPPPFDQARKEFDSLMLQGLYRAAFGVLDIKLKKSVQSEADKIRYLKLRALYHCDVQVYSNAKIEIESLIELGCEDDEVKALSERVNGRLLLENIDRFVQRNPDVGGAYCGTDLVRARVYATLKDFDEALRCVESHMRMYPEDATARALRVEIDRSISIQTEKLGLRRSLDRNG